MKISDIFSTVKESWLFGLEDPLGKIKGFTYPTIITSLIIPAFFIGLTISWWEAYQKEYPKKI